jgi:hypothetical protein
VSSQDRKQQLVNKLENSRREFSYGIAGLREDLNVSRNFQRCFRRHKIAWLAGSALTGWILARLPARKKKVKVYVDRHDRKKIKEVKRGGALMALAKFAIGIAKPAITAYATKKVADLAATAEKVEQKQPR